MMPRFSIYDAPYMGTVNAELLREESNAVFLYETRVAPGGIFDRKPLYFSHLIIGQLRGAMRRTSRYSVGMPAFFHHVGHVVGLRSKEQMMRIYAGWIVAAVKNALGCRDDAKVQFPAKPMGRIPTIFPYPERDDAVSISEFCSLPIPAPMREFLYFLPEAIRKIARFSLAHGTHCNMLSLTVGGGI